MLLVGQVAAMSRRQQGQGQAGHRNLEEVTIKVKRINKKLTIFKEEDAIFAKPGVVGECNLKRINVVIINHSWTIWCRNK